MKNGGSAYPVLKNHVKHTGQYAGIAQYTEGGMTLRDYFAGQALEGLCSECNFSGDDIDFEGMVKDAYRFADTMLAEREKKE